MPKEPAAADESTLDSIIPDSNVYGANMEPTWVLSAPGGPHVGPMNLAIRDGLAPSDNNPLPQLVLANNPTSFWWHYATFPHGILVISNLLKDG